MTYSFKNSTATKLFLVLMVLLCIIGIGFYNSSNGSKTEKKLDTSTKNEQVTDSKETFTIIAFGDSLTAGYGGPLEDSYPVQLEKQLQQQYKNITVLNMGVSGESTSGSLDRVNFIIAQKPSLVLLETGANDMLRSTPPQLVEENLRKILDRFKQENIQVVLLGMKSVASNGTQYQRRFDSLYSSLAQEYSLPFVPFFLEGVALVPELNTSDGVHPNKAGYEKIIKENILPVLLPVLSRIGV